MKIGKGIVKKYSREYNRTLKNETFYSIEEENQVLKIAN